ncbi:MAG TPA: hypothetical protein VIY29_17545 [Ktedonobacteraceae bacterium]
MRTDPFAKQPASNCFAGWTGSGERAIFLLLSIVGQSSTTPVPSVTHHGLFLALAAMTLVTVCRVDL